MANQQQQQIIVIPGNMLINSKQNGASTATMEQVKSILKLANTSNPQNLQLKTIVTSTNAKSTPASLATTTVSSNTVIPVTPPTPVGCRASVVLPTIVKTAPNAAIVRPVNATQKTSVTKTTCHVPPNNSISLQQQPKQVQIASNSPRVISLKRPYSSITCASSDVAEPSVIKLSSASHIQGLSSITTDHIKEEDSDSEQANQSQVRKRANLDHMTVEEKMMRRKLKNRVAAQNARDKKRVKMDDMEDRIQRLEDENQRILEQNKQLMEFNRRLTGENQRLMKNGGIQETTSIIKMEPQTYDDIDVGQNGVLCIPPLSPESLPRSPSPSSSISSSTMTHHQRLSSFDDEMNTSSVGSVVSSDSSDVSSLVEQRSVEPAEGTRSTFGRGRGMQQSGVQQQQVVGSVYNSSLFDLSDVNSTTGGQRFIITKQEDSDGAIKGAHGSTGLLDFTTKEENESRGSIPSSNGQDGEGYVATADIDDSWLSDLMVMNTSINNNNMDKQAIVDNEGSIFTPSCHDNTATTAALLLDKYLVQQNLQQQQQQHQPQAPIMDNEEFDTYFNELFPDLAL